MFGHRTRAPPDRAPARGWAAASALFVSCRCCDSGPAGALLGRPRVRAGGVGAHATACCGWSRSGPRSSTSCEPDGRSGGRWRDILRAALILAVSAFSILFLVHAPEVSRVFLVMLFASQIAFSIAQRRLLRAMLVAARNRRSGTRPCSCSARGTPRPSCARASSGTQPSGTGSSAPGIAVRSTARSSSGRSMPSRTSCTIRRGRGGRGPRNGRAHLSRSRGRALPRGGQAAARGTPARARAAAGRDPRIADGKEILTVSNGPDRLLGLAVKRALDMSRRRRAAPALARVLASRSRFARSGLRCSSPGARGRHGRRFAISSSAP